MPPVCNPPYCAKRIASIQSMLLASSFVIIAFVDVQGVPQVSAIPLGMLTRQDPAQLADPMSLTDRTSSNAQTPLQSFNVFHLLRQPLVFPIVRHSQRCTIFVYFNYCITTRTAGWRRSELQCL
ncbi:hypothetical protein BDQ17DRAFT_520622 [Cyathus striatus]|nr:hypothetical protein BDQ17DRAFT_520622 [Cyathus striatus]